MIIPSDFFFKSPAAAYLLLLLPIFLLFFWGLFHFRRKSLRQYADEAILPLIPRSTAIYWSKCAAFFIAWSAATAALMQPQGNGHYPGENQGKPKGESLRQKAQEIILLIDCSGSMAVPDSRNGMTRLDYAKDIADELVSKLSGQSLALFGFTSQVTPLSPSTMDYLYVRLMLRQMQLNEGDVAGTDIVKALKEIEKYIQTLPPTRLKRLILISDGGDTALETMPDNEREQSISSLLNLFDDAKTLNLHMDAIGMGSHKGGTVPDVTFQGNPVFSSLQDDLLRRLARRGGGIYMEANSMTSPDMADRLIAALDQDAAHAPVEQTLPSAGARKTVVYDHYYQIPLILSLLALIYIIAWPDTWRKA